MRFTSFPSSTATLFSHSFNEMRWRMGTRPIALKERTERLLNTFHFLRFKNQLTGMNSGKFIELLSSKREVISTLACLNWHYLYLLSEGFVAIFFIPVLILGKTLNRYWVLTVF